LSQRSLCYPCINALTISSSSNEFVEIAMNSPTSQLQHAAMQLENNWLSLIPATNDASMTAAEFIGRAFTRTIEENNGIKLVPTTVNPYNAIW
jgi:hypothetical protein